jgi:hypothetical protein
VLAQPESRADLFKQIEAKRAELEILEKQILEPSAQDRAAYADFLQLPNTGLVRLLPREKYDDQAYRGIAKSSVTIRGGGAYYSFSANTHDYNAGRSEIGLEMRHLSVGFAGANYGMLARLDGARLEDLSNEVPGVIFLANYKAVSTEPEARVEQRRFGTGATIDGMSYKTRLRVEVGATYILRSVNYSSSDVLVAFRVDREDSDGSIIIAWKLLQKYPVPRLSLNQAKN